MARTVAQAMSAPIAAGRELALIAAARVMRDEGVGALPVVEGGRLVGLLTDRDVVVRAVAGDLDAHTTCVGDVASSDLVYVRPSQPLDHALQVMATHQIRRVPVVDDEYRLIGTITQRDIARAAGGRRVGGGSGLNRDALLPIS